MAVNKGSSSGPTKNGIKRVSYCPQCPIPDLPHPQTAPHCTVNVGQKVGSCKNGHRWKVEGSLYH